MDNNIDMNNLIKKAQEMMQNNQIPEELKNAVSQLSSNNTVNSRSDSSSQSSNDSDISVENTNSSANYNSNLDISKLSKLLNSATNQQNDDMSKLLYALKPYLRDQKQEKLDDYIKLIQMGKIAQFMDIIGGEKK